MLGREETISLSSLPEKASCAWPSTSEGWPEMCSPECGLFRMEASFSVATHSHTRLSKIYFL